MILFFNLILFYDMVKKDVNLSEFSEVKWGEKSDFFFVATPLFFFCEQL